MTARPRIALLGLTVLLVSACGGDATTTTTPMPPTSESLVPAPTLGPDDLDLMQQEAHGLLGMNEDDLPEEVRIARRGEEAFALTEDHVIGRRTVELDDTDGSGFRVTIVHLEVPSGVETFELEAG